MASRIGSVEMLEWLVGDAAGSPGWSDRCRREVPAAPPLTKPGASSPPREGRDWAHLADTATVPLSNKERKALEKLENMALRAKATSTGAAGSRAGLRRQGGQGCF